MDLIYRYDPYQPIQASFPDNSAEALAELRQGNQRFLTFVRHLQGATLGEKVHEQLVIPVSPLSLGLPLWHGGAPSQAPFALFLGCSDARVPIEQVFDQAFNSLFVVRIAGNVLGAEAMGSVDFAVRNLGNSLKLVVVLGHTTCGAVSAAVDMYVSPIDFGQLACTHALRSLVDRILIAVRASSKALTTQCGIDVLNHPNYRAALMETSVYLNAAITAFDLRRELRDVDHCNIDVVYGVYDLETQRVSARPATAPAPPGSEALLSPALDRAEAFHELAATLVQSVLAKGLLG